MSHFRDRLAATAQPQTGSPFFERLPSEIRQKIYQELWDLYDTRWHVHTLGVPGPLGPVFPCITTPEEEDIRWNKFQTSLSEDLGIWESRLRSPWNAHWKCAEAASTKLSRLQKRRATPADPVKFRPLLLSSPLLVCRRMYIENIVALENVFTYCLTDTIVARNFLTEYSTTRNIRNLDISLRIKPVITELYFPGPDGEPQPHIGGITITSKNNPWEDLCRQLASLPNLHTVHIRLDSEDLRPWHKRVNESKFFEQLLQVKARRFVLDLPEIPDQPELQALPGCYLEVGVLKDMAYEVKRSQRPNNWQLHLSRISHVLPENWSHTLWNQVREKIHAV
ncbi:hypothetical protein N0V82_006100 [Gnomoniopsis sp. IMI 355080]|nr:hypothetical protein N0V82_006100 [Gnomoniopsis sp. IMI 355080]